MYHYTRDLVHGRYPRIKGMDAADFRRQMEFFSTHFHVLRMEELLDAVENNTGLPDNAMLLTFDDGYIDHYTVALPVLEEFGFQGSFFIPAKAFSTHQLLDVNRIHYILANAPTGQLVADLKRKMDDYRDPVYDYPSNEELWNAYARQGRYDAEDVIFVKRMLQTVLPEPVRKRISGELFAEYADVTEEQLAYELYMTEDQIRTMKRHGMFIGVHGYDHYWLANLEEEKMQQDIIKALEVMDGFIDTKRWVMNYPYGNYNTEVVSFAKQMGACLGLTTEVGISDLDMHHMMELPRTDCNDYPPVSEQYTEIGR